MSAARFTVHGRVQGVWFRASTQAQARTLGLRGHARNLDDGDVDVLVAGDDASLRAMEAGLQHGPAQARVEHVLRVDADDADVGAGFEIL